MNNLLMHTQFNRYNSMVIITLFIVSTVFFAWQTQYFRVDASADTLLMKGNKLYIAAQEANQTFSTSEFILVAFKPNNSSIFSNETLTTIANISQELKRLDRIESVRSLVNVPIFTELDSISSDINPNNLTWEANSYSPEMLDRSLSSHPLYEGLLFNSDKTALSIQINFNQNKAIQELNRRTLELQKIQLTSDLSEDDKKLLENLKRKKDKINQSLEQKRSTEIRQIREIVDRYEEHGKFYLGGGSLLTHQLINIIKNDLLLFGSLISAVICTLLYIVFHQLRWVMLPALCCAVSVITTLGLLGLFELKVTVISTNVIALQIILTLAIVVHLITQYNEFENDGINRTREELVNLTVRSKIKPCFYAGITTSVGFASLVFSGVAPVISFGWMMVIAMLVTLGTSLLLFPAIILVATRSTVKTSPPKVIRQIMLGLFYVCQYPKTTMIISVLLVIVGIIGCLKLTVENSFLNYFHKSTEVYRELSYIDKEFGGSTPFDVIYTVPHSQADPNLIVSADTVKKVKLIHDFISEQRAIGNVTSIADFAIIAKVTAGKPITEYEITSLYRTLDKGLQEDLFGPYYSATTKQARISSRVQDTTKDLNRAELVSNIKTGINELGIEDSSFELTNLFILYQDILSRLVDSQIKTLAIVYAAMGLILLAIFGSFRVAIICLVPNLVTTAMIMGVMGWAKIPLDLMTITIAAVAMGISVDDTIHYTHRFQQEMGKGSTDPIKSTHLSVGYALLYTTLIIAIGFSSLVLSDFVPSMIFGVLTSGAMIIALLADATVLPILLKWNSKKSA